MAGNQAGQNTPAMNVGLTSLPYDPFTPFLLKDEPIRVQTASALPSDNSANIMNAEWTYALMMHVSSALGVNCTYCHLTQAFVTWDGAPPARVSAWYGIRMVRDLNNKYLLPLQGVLPANRLGPLGDVPKINCTTCHQGVTKPLNGVSMLANHPELARIKPPPPPPPPDAAAAVPAVVPAESAAVAGTG